MIPEINYDKITGLFHFAEKESRNFLYEHETYELLKNSGAETPPLVEFLAKGSRLSADKTKLMPGDKVVLKIVSPTIFHKTDIGGVKIIENHPEQIRSATRRMIDEVPVKFARWIEKNPSLTPENYTDLTGEKLEQAISGDIKGVILCQFMPPDSMAFGNELIVSIRRTREFGMVITAGLGGTDTELYAKRFKKGQAVVSASTELTDGARFFNLFKKTIAFKKLAGVARGQERIVSDDQLIECFSSFIEMANTYSPVNPDAPYVIDELEINPFAFTDYKMVPLDGICRFSHPFIVPAKRPITKIDSLLHPESIAIMGVSDKKMNFGRIILKNILAAGFPPEKITIIKPGIEKIDGVRCVPSLSELSQKKDLFVVAVGADQVPELVDQVIDLDCANSVMLIPGGLGEKKGSEERAELIMDKLNIVHQSGDGGPVFLGGNSMGVISHPGRYDTIFIPEEKLPKQKGSHRRNSAFISQSGAFIITRTSKYPLLDPAYMISIGNQNDLTIGDLVSFVKDLDHIQVIAIYMEGFNDLDGLFLCKAIRQAVLNGKDVVFYKAGRTPEGKSATSGHTASVAGDYMVCESCIHQAGAMVADNFTQFEDLFMLASRFHGAEVNGNRLAAVSGAGFEAVGMADSILGDDYEMKMAEFSSETEGKLEELIRNNRLDNLVDVKNPMDINPAANDRLHAKVVEVLANDPNVNGIVVGLDPLSPAMQTLPSGFRKQESIDSDESIVQLLPAVIGKVKKPVLGVVDGGKLYDDMVNKLENKGVCVFRSSDRAVAALAKYISCRLHRDRILEYDSQ
ncbi:acetate--CoA ligase family protein [bacterium]|nr:acetate--CoA ligase family protein [bacterium]